MGITNFGAIKRIVRNNFDNSANMYDNFEKQHGLFQHLTRHLAETCNIEPGMMVFDIGCGSGVSSFVLSDLVGKNGRVYGIDFSNEMLALAKKKQEHLNEQDNYRGSYSNIDFIRCSADIIDEKLKCRADSVLYNACIFLIPDHAKSLQSAYELLNPAGTIGMNYLIGVFDKNSHEVNSSINLFDQLRSAGKTYAPYGRQIVDTGTLVLTLEKLNFKNIRKGTISIEFTLEKLHEFYSIPAQSASLWPKKHYDERIELLAGLIRYFEENQNIRSYQHWGWIVAEK